ncbi:restriction endonuclease [bacterium]|nr:restriction endonuclease [bacterium]
MVRGSDPYVVKQKALAQQAAWDEMWARKQERETAVLHKEHCLEEAQKQTIEAKETLEAIENTLNHTLDIDDTINWDLLKDRTPFSKAKPREPICEKIPIEPKEDFYEFVPQLGFLDKLISSRRIRKETECKEHFNNAHEMWVKKCGDIQEWFQRERSSYEQEIRKWESEKREYHEEQLRRNSAVDERKTVYLSGDAGAVTDYCDLVLSNSEYPDSFPQSFQLDYLVESKTVLVDYFLPCLESIPTLREVSYVKSRDEFVEKHISEKERNRLYDSAIYQIAIRSLHELFEADAANAIDSIVFNGWVEYIDKATGKDTTACILSIQSNKGEFSEINLSQVDPKACFKKLKGVAAAQLHGMSPVAPLLKIDRSDARFISSYDVAGTLDDSVNIAAMDWEDFEHLIREIFEKEFSQTGGEVKVTRASRDGGVDAVAFDPDPIRGGKIVIQAKRYTNTVGVSAVRDLYGTVINEGASKGILITTAEYGNDAYSFAKDKPLTLLTGSNLLHLLSKHGYHAKIDLKEAKLQLAAEEN